VIVTKDIKNINRLIKIIKTEFTEFNRNKDKYLIAAMIVNKNKFSIGFNNYVKTHPTTIQPSTNYVITTHAEIDAINKWNENWEITKSTTLYVTGLTATGNFCNSSKPCKPCMETIRPFGIKRIIYTTRSINTFTLNLLEN
jgi:tRNA(Arg) A34 adenosine deaminase TadA